MLWSNHRLIGLCLAFSMTGQLLPAVCSYYGSVYPDKVEGFEFQDPNWWRNHRMSSHYWIFYMAVFCLGYRFATSGHLAMDISLPTLWHSLNNQALSPETIIIPLVLYAAMWFAFGGLTHILADSFCGHVPGLTPSHRVGTRLFIVGSLKEHYYAKAFSLTVIALRYLLTYQQGTFFLGP